MEHAIINELLQKIKTPYFSKLELYIVTEENIYYDKEKYMIACFYSYEKSKRLFYYKKNNNIENTFRYEIKMVRITKDTSETLLLCQEIEPCYKTITLSNILKYLKKLHTETLKLHGVNTVGYT